MALPGEAYRRAKRIVPRGLRPFIENWEVVAVRIIRRGHREVADNPSGEILKCFLEKLLSYPNVPSRWHMLD